MKKLILDLYNLFDVIKKKNFRRSLSKAWRYDPPFNVGGFLFDFRAQGYPPSQHIKATGFPWLSHFVTGACTLRYNTTEDPITTMQLQTFVCVLAGLLVLSCTLQTAAAQSNQGKMKSMAEVLQILQNLDKYYSQAARPSPYKDVSEIQEAVHKIRLRELDRNYLQRTRPRFGKRTYPALEERLFNAEEVPAGEPQPWERFIR